MNVKKNLLIGICVCSIALVSIVSFITPASAEQVDVSKLVLTEGTSLSAETKFAKIPEKITSSGFRFKCRVSHLNYDDPILFPGQENAAHLHTFVGNTETNANTTVASLKNKGNSTCGSGNANKSAYWMPTMIDKDQNSVLPYIVNVYYKQHYDKENTQEVPDNLQLIGSKNVQGCNDNRIKYFDCAKVRQIDNNRLLLTVHFPNCLKVDSNGKPVLSSNDNSHGVFGRLKCPKGFPYRLPTISIHFTYYNMDKESDWKLSSDIMDPNNPKPKGSTLHADLFTAWDDSVRKDMRSCHLKGQNCSLSLDAKEANLSPEGETIYKQFRYNGNKFKFGKLPAVLSTHAKMNHGSHALMTQNTNEKASVSVDASDEELDSDLLDDITQVSDAKETAKLTQLQKRRALEIKRKIRLNNQEINRLQSDNTSLEKELSKL